MSEETPARLYDRLQSEIDRIVIDNDDIIEGLTIALLTRGHVLLEGVPGVAKTTIARAFSRAVGLQYNRIQMTPDILPADITGTHIYREQTGEFELRTGPVFTNLAVADEINRATPKTQSALLEAMQERQVTIEGETVGLPDPFLVIATQNPIEMEGTFELPEAQRDRFQLKYVVDLPERAAERELIDRFDSNPDLSAEAVSAVVDRADLLAARGEVTGVHVSESIREYVLDIVHATRSADGLAHGASPRASLAFLNAGKARAAIRGRDYIIPDDIKTLARPILIHRVVRGADARLGDRSTAEIIESILENLPAPGADEAVDDAPEAARPS
ncbi:AAA family ATPase [Haloferacaceae archaeon DSL9]